MGSTRRWATLAGLIAIAAIATLPASASAAPCPGGTTSWLGGDGEFNLDANWSNGGPSSACDTVITNPGTYTVSMTGGASMKSFTFGNATGTQTLSISGVNPNTNLNATTSPSSIGANAEVVLTCPILSCNGGGGPALNFLGTTVTNEGKITVDSASGGSTLSGSIVNTGTIQINGPTAQNNGTLLNQGEINIADGKVFKSATSHCGDTTSAIVKNDIGGEINATGTGTLDAYSYEQGAGTTSGTNPVQLPCGTVKYTGNGASTVQAYGGFTLSGEMQSNQSLTVTAASSNTNAILASDFVNKGSITFTCPGGGCSGGSGGGPGLNGNGKAFTNAGTFTVAAASGTGTSLGSGSPGSVTNTGTMSFNQSAFFGGIVVNKGTINIADGKTVTSSGSSCGDAGGQVKNDTGGQINAAGTGTFNIATNYEQGNGSTSGATPVQMPCGGHLKYTGNGASSVQVNGGFNLSGEMHPNQALTISAAGSNTTAHLQSDFVNKGSITLTCPGGGCSGGPGGGAGFNINGKAFTNAGTFTVAAASGTGAGPSNGTMTNTGTMQFDQSAGVSGTFVNGGAINIAGGKTVGFPPFASSGTITINPGGALNASTLTSSGRLAGGGTVNGSVDSSGAVAPGASPGTLTINGNYTQGVGGSLEIEVAGTAAGQFDKLAVNGNATLGGTLALQPTAGYAASSVPGDSVAFLTYGGTRTNPFAATTVTPSLDCPKQLTATYNDGPKNVSATVSSSGVKCETVVPPKPPSPVATTPPPVVIPKTTLKTHPGSVVKTKKAKAKVTFTFSSDVSRATFQCKLDKGAYGSCTSPKSYKAKPGKHKFSVLAVGAGGETGAAVSFSFKVVKKKR